MRKAPHIEPELLKKLRDRIIKIIQEKDIPLDAIADRTGFGSAQVYRIIYGKKNTSISNLFAIAKAMEVHILDFFVIDFPIPEYDIPLSYFRKNSRDSFDKSSKSEKDKLLTAAEAVRKLTYENYFQKDENSGGKTLSDVLSECQSRFRPNFIKSEFSSALRYAIKTMKLKRYKKNGAGPYIYYSEN